MVDPNEYRLRVSILGTTQVLYWSSFKDISELWERFRKSYFCPEYIFNSNIVIDSIKDLTLYKYVCKGDADYSDYRLGLVEKAAIYCFGFLIIRGGKLYTLMCEVWEPYVEYL